MAVAREDEDVAVNEAAVEGIAGAGGAIIALLATYPLLTINTRQQTGASNNKKKTQDEGNGNDLEKGKGGKGGDAVEGGQRKSTFDEAREILRTRGVPGLYAGLKPAFMGTICSNLVYFYLCGYLREAWTARRAKGRSEPKQLNALESLAIASLAGCGNVLMTNPIWILVTRMQANRKTGVEGVEGTNATLAETAKKLYEESGVLGFWKGVAASLIMVSNPSIQYMFFESLSNMRLDASGRGPKPMTAFEVFCNSALAKLGATVITYPMLVVKSNMQNFSKQSSGSQKEGGYSIAGTVKTILDKEGPGGFYKGMKTKIFQSVFAASLLYMSKEEIKKGARALVRSVSRKR
ncbi:mitochondrial carrier protein [Chloropicon primus]|nr:mitochondrial carrier protein [Chloropicon primus]